MNNISRQRYGFLPIAAIVIFFLIMTVALSSCEPLRKKFTRTKKQTEENLEIPVLEPIEYPKKVHTPQGDYKRYYQLWKVWSQDLLTSLSEGEGSKRELYLLNQAVTNLNAMQQFLPSAKQNILNDSLMRLKRIQEDIEAAVPTRNTSSLVIELQSIEKNIRDHYSFDKVKDVIQESEENLQTK